MDERRETEPTVKSHNPVTVERKGEREIVVTRTFDAPARIVFEAWRNVSLQPQRIRHFRRNLDQIGNTISPNHLPRLVICPRAREHSSIEPVYRVLHDQLIQHPHRVPRQRRRH